MSALDVIKSIEAEIGQGHARIQAIRDACDHKWRPSNADTLSSSPYCPECGARKGGWWCEESPTKECDYKRVNGRGYNPDDCRYCHQPSERK